MKGSKVKTHLTFKQEHRSVIYNIPSLISFQLTQKLPTLGEVYCLSSNSSCLHLFLHWEEEEAYSTTCQRRNICLVGLSRDAVLATACPMRWMAG